jgi:hypothetical protein
MAARRLAVKNVLSVANRLKITMYRYQTKTAHRARNRKRKMENKIIMYDSPEAAQLKDLKLWVAHGGFAYEDESTARYAGCTHKVCACGEVTEKHYIFCKNCRDKKDREKYLSLPVVPWDGVTPLCIFNSDHYFFDESELEDYCEENECKKEDLQILICRPQFAHEIQGDIYEDLLPDEADLPDEIQNAIDECNKKIKEYGKPLSWIQGKERPSWAQGAEAERARDSENRTPREKAHG